MNNSVIPSLLLKEQSNQRPITVYSAENYLAEKGYKVQCKLGCSSLGATELGQNNKNQRKVVIKQLHIKSYIQILSFTQQFKIIKELYSPYTVHLLGMLSDFENNYFFLVMDFEENGNLETFISDNPNLSDSQIITMFIQILRGLIFLKKNNIIHGNLKPSNILLSYQNTPKIADYGFSTQSQRSRVQQKNKEENLCYEAPEQSQGHESQIESDWFTAGLILFRLCGNHDVAQILQIKEGNFPDITQLSHSNIVKVAFKMLVTSPKDRASPEEVIYELQKICEKLPPPPNPEFKRIQYGDGYYEGEIMNNIRNGQGNYFWNNGDRYEGEWKHDKEHGKGKKISKYGDIYEGEWKDGKQNGQGKKIQKFGDRYEGGWKDGQYHGQGKKFWFIGNIYEGEWKDGIEHGQGTKFWKNGHIQDGEWKDGKMDGQGEYFKNNGDRYEGEWKNGEFNGQGKIFWRRGSRYEGKWRNGRLHGQGTYFQNNGVTYEGEWKYNSLKSMGKRLHSNGNLTEEEQ